MSDDKKYVKSKMWEEMKKYHGEETANQAEAWARQEWDLGGEQEQEQEQKLKASRWERIKSKARRKSKSITAKIKQTKREIQEAPGKIKHYLHAELPVTAPSWTLAHLRKVEAVLEKILEQNQVAYLCSKYASAEELGLSLFVPEEEEGFRTTMGAGSLNSSSASNQSIRSGIRLLSQDGEVIAAPDVRVVAHERGAAVAQAYRGKQNVERARLVHSLAEALHTEDEDKVEEILRGLDLSSEYIGLLTRAVLKARRQWNSSEEKPTE